MDKMNKDQSTETRLRELLAQTRTHVAGSLAREIDAALTAAPAKPSAGEELVFLGNWIVEDLGEGDVVTLWMGGTPRNLPFEKKWLFEDVCDRHNAAIRAARTAPSEDTKRLDWLIETGNYGYLDHDSYSEYPVTGDLIRAKIDAAMNAGKK
jgi:hypothetical protein